MSELMNSVNEIAHEMNEKAKVNAVYGVPDNGAEGYDGGYVDTDTTLALSEAEAPTISTEQSAISAILSGDIENSFRVITGKGEFSARESYQLTRPDDDDAISIGRGAKNAVIEIDRYLVYAFENNGAERVGIVILSKDGRKYVTTSAYFIKEFLLLAMLYQRDGDELTKIKVIYKTSKNTTVDGQALTYPMPLGL